MSEPPKITHRAQKGRAQSHTQARADLRVPADLREESGTRDLARNPCGRDARNQAHRAQRATSF